MRPGTEMDDDVLWSTVRDDLPALLALVPRESGR